MDLQTLKDLKQLALTSGDMSSCTKLFDFICNEIISLENQPEQLFETIAQAKSYLKENHEKGVKCPCCDQMVKLYHIKLGSNMAMFLISLVNLYQTYNRPIHYKECKFESRNYPFLQHWGLAHTNISETPDKKTSGLWMPTERGINFVNKMIKIQSTALIYNNKCFGFEGENITIEEALGNKFNYNELVNHRS